MKTSTLVFCALIIGLLSAGFVMYFTNSAPVSEELSDTDLPPANKPATSAPRFAIEACENKVVGDTCVMQFGGEDITGACFQSGSAIACGPTTPTGPGATTEEDVSLN